MLFVTRHKQKERLNKGHCTVVDGQEESPARLQGGTAPASACALKCKCESLLLATVARLKLEEADAVI